LHVALKHFSSRALQAKSVFDRPLVTMETEEILRGIVGAQGQHSIYVCGAYSRPGIPLLEQAAESGLAVAEMLGV
jgi:predicted NAD/FAD-binding protein